MNKEKPRFRYWQGKWWCKYTIVVGNGITIMEAWEDMVVRALSAKSYLVRE